MNTVTDAAARHLRARRASRNESTVDPLLRAAGRVKIAAVTYL
jgi:hypothetical protein